MVRASLGFGQGLEFAGYSWDMDSAAEGLFHRPALWKDHVRLLSHPLL